MSTFADRPAEQPVGVQRRRVGDVDMVVVTGEIDMLTAPGLHEAIDAALHEPAGSLLVVDLTAVAFFGSAGLSVLLAGDARARECGGRMRVVVGENAVVRLPLEVTGLDQVLALYSSVEAAITAA